jgi:hypothetical protein
MHTLSILLWQSTGVLTMCFYSVGAVRHLPLLCGLGAGDDALRGVPPAGDQGCAQHCHTVVCSFKDIVGVTLHIFGFLEILVALSDAPVYVHTSSLQALAAG